MDEGTSVLLGLEDEFAVLQVDRIDPDMVRVVIEVIDGRGRLPGLRGAVLAGQGAADWSRVKDLPGSGQT